MSNVVMTDKEVDQLVRIGGTRFDRRRKVTPDMVRKMNEMLNDGVRVSHIARELGVAYSTVKYNTSREFKAKANRERMKYAFVKVTPLMTHERIEYKKSLVTGNQE